MSEQNTAPAEGESTETQPALTQQQTKMLTIMYALFGAGIIVPFTTIAGVIVAYIQRGKYTDAVAQAHMRWIIRTFWFSMLWFVIGAVLSIVVIGYFVLIAAVVWYIYRTIKGYIRLTEGQPPVQALPEPASQTQA